MSYINFRSCKDKQLKNTINHQIGINHAEKEFFTLRKF